MGRSAWKAGGSEFLRDVTEGESGVGNDRELQGESDGRERSMPGLELSRRQVLHVAGVGVAALGMGSLLTACGSGDGSSASTGGTPASGTPKQGGKLRLGQPGNGAAETINPAKALTGPDYTRIDALFDGLVKRTGDLDPEKYMAPALAVEWEPTKKDLTEWQVKLRPDVTWHDGKPFTADDVIWTMKFSGTDEHIGKRRTKNIRLNDLKKVDDLTFILPLKRPDSRPLDEWDVGGSPSAAILPDGVKDAKGNGTGSWILESFTPGQRSLFKRNPDYWGDKPYADQLELISSFKEEDPIVNALLSKSVDIISQIGYQSYRRLNGDAVGYAVPGSNDLALCMRVDRAPFDDVRVRQAIRLAMNRQAIVDSVFSGEGEILNDLYGKGLPFYASSIEQREQDIEQAKSLLKSAGREDLRVELVAADSEPGMVDSATVFAEQAKAAGITIRIKKIPLDQIFNSSAGYPYDFGSTTWPAYTLNYQTQATLLSDSPFPETGWNDPAWEEQYWSAVGTLEPEQAQEANDAWQQVLWDRGGYVWYATPGKYCGGLSNVKGVKTDNFLQGTAYSIAAINGLWFES